MLSPWENNQARVSLKLIEKDWSLLSCTSSVVKLDPHHTLCRLCTAQLQEAPFMQTTTCTAYMVALTHRIRCVPQAYSKAKRPLRSQCPT